MDSVGRSYSSTYSSVFCIKYAESVGTDARKIFVNPKKRIVKFEFVTFGPMRGERREVVHG